MTLLELLIKKDKELVADFFLDEKDETLNVTGENYSLNIPNNICDEIILIIEDVCLDQDKSNYIFKEVFRVSKDNSKIELNILSEYFIDSIEFSILSNGFIQEDITNNDGILTIIYSKTCFSIKSPLVSLVVPTYKPQYFTKALNSLVNQSYKNIEIIVSDNCPTEDIKDIVDTFSNFYKITYYRNPERFIANFQNCFNMANGKYIKFLLDDDMLTYNCVEKMVSCFESYKDNITLVTSKRHKIDEYENRLPDDGSSQERFINDTFLVGKDIGNFMLVNLQNVIGEMSTTMFRKSDLIDSKPHFCSFLDHDPISNIDMSSWINLLSKGNMIYIAEPLSFFRTNPYQNTHKSLPISIIEWFELIMESRKVGFIQDNELYKEALTNLLNCFDYYKTVLKEKEKLDTIDQYIEKTINKIAEI